MGGRKIQTKIAILQSSLSQLLKQGTETSGFLNHWFRPMERFVTGQPHQTEHQTTQSALGTRETRSTKHFQREVTHNYWPQSTLITQILLDVHFQAAQRQLSKYPCAIQPVLGGSPTSSERRQHYTGALRTTQGLLGLRRDIHQLHLPQLWDPLHEDVIAQGLLNTGLHCTQE